jgi:lactate dehydrogenase-like 2-hydroxyacid dehydrogenase
MRTPILVLGTPLAVVDESLREHFDARRDPDPSVRGLAVNGGHQGLDAAVLEKLPALEIVASFGVGYDHIDAIAMARRGVVVTNTPDVLTEEVADLALGLLLATVRRLPQAERFLREGRWLKGNFPLSPTLRGRKVGILGLGRIGKALARRLEASAVEIEYHGRTHQPEVKYRYHSTLLDLAKSCTVLIVTATGGAPTRHLVNREVLDALGPDGILINVGRGSIVDEAALIEALRDRRILSAGIDVFDDEPRVPAELMAMDNVVLLPHVGSGSVHTRNAMGRLMVDNLISWFAGKGAITPVPESRALLANRAK